MERLLTSTEAARLLGLSGDTVRRLSDRGVLPHVRLHEGTRLYRYADVVRLAEERATRLRECATEQERRLAAERPHYEV